MLVVRSKQELNEHLAEWRQHGDHIALVPTMGNLHAGHMSLVDLASEHAERIVVSVFVNPTQFSNGEDFDQYPRTLERDTRRIKNLPADSICTRRRNDVSVWTARCDHGIGATFN